MWWRKMRRNNPAFLREAPEAMPSQVSRRKVVTRAAIGALAQASNLASLAILKRISGPSYNLYRSSQTWVCREDAQILVKTSQEDQRYNLLTSRLTTMLSKTRASLFHTFMIRATNNVQMIAIRQVPRVTDLTLNSTCSGPWKVVRKLSTTSVVIE